MTDYAALRRVMVESQVRTNDVPDLRLQEAMGTIPRERFVPPHRRAMAYADKPVEVAPGRFLMDPRSFAKLAHLADIADDDLILTVGCATGYSAAVLARMGRAVVGLESDQDLVRIAVQALGDLRVANATIVGGGLGEGVPTEGPFDVIFVDGGIGFVPDPLLRQLRDGGRLVAILVDGPLGKAHVFTRDGQGFADRIGFDATVPMLPGFVRPRGFVF